MNRLPELGEKLRAVRRSGETRKVLGTFAYSLSFIGDPRALAGRAIVSGDPTEVDEPYMALCRAWHSALRNGGYYTPNTSETEYPDTTIDITR